MSNLILIDEFSKCRLESIFGNGIYFGCFTISKLVMAIGMSALVILILIIIIKLNSKPIMENETRIKKTTF